LSLINLSRAAQGLPDRAAPGAFRQTLIRQTAD
jgi:hypothetical protein